MLLMHSWLNWNWSVDSPQISYISHFTHNLFIPSWRTLNYLAKYSLGILKNVKFFSFLPNEAHPFTKTNNYATPTQPPTPQHTLTRRHIYSTWTTHLYIHLFPSPASLSLVYANSSKKWLERRDLEPENVKVGNVEKSLVWIWLTNNTLQMLSWQDLHIWNWNWHNSSGEKAETWKDFFSSMQFTNVFFHMFSGLGQFFHFEV